MVEETSRDDWEQEPRRSGRGQPYSVSHLPGAGAPGPAGTHPPVIPGMIVLGQDGRTIGRVKEVREGDFLVDRMMARDVYVPFDAIALVDGQAVALTIATDQIDNMGWPQPPLVA